MRKLIWTAQRLIAIGTFLVAGSASVAYSAPRFESEFFTPRLGAEAAEAFAYEAEPLFVVESSDSESPAESTSQEVGRELSSVVQTPPGFQLPRGRDYSSMNRGSSGGTASTVFGISMFVAATGDLATTEIALGRPGMYEANPLQRNRTVRVVSHIAVPALIWWATERVEKKGNGKLALVLRVAVTAIYSYATMHNAQQLR